MIAYYFRLFTRTLFRQRMFSAINLMGLTAGIVSSLFIYLYVSHEMSYDKFHANADRIYRINQTFIWGDDNNQLFASLGPGVAHAITAEVPEAKHVTRILPPGNSLMTYNGPGNKTVSFEQSGILAVDSNFFKVFSFNLISGNPDEALRNADAIVLTESAARKYFGDEEPIGKLIQSDKFDVDQTPRVLQVTGVVADPPTNSYIDFDVLVSMSTFPRVKRASWSWVWTMFETFVLLDDKASASNLVSKLNVLPKKYAEQTLQNAMGTTYDKYTESGKEWKLYAQPLTDIHLKSGTTYNRINETGNIRIVYTLTGIVGFIILLSCINFMNLSTAQYTKRAKESSLRKILGSNRWQLGSSFFFEAMAFCTIALILGIGITQLFIPQFNVITGNNYSLDFLLQPVSLAMIIGLVIVMSLLSGSYPAIFMSAFHPVDAIKGRIKSGREGRSLRNGLVIFQFSVSIILLVSTVIAYQQMKYLGEADTGFDRENLLVLSRLEKVKDKQTFLDEVNNISQVESSSWCTSAPPRLYDGDGFAIEGQQDKVISLNYVMADEKYAPTLKLNFAIGRNFSDERPADVYTVILNETAVREAGWLVDENVLGKRISYPGDEQKYEIIGIVKDFNYWSLQGAIQPMALFNIKGPMSFSNREFATIRLSGSNKKDWTKSIASLEQSWKKFAGDIPFQYEFVDDAFAESFASEDRFAKALMIFAGLAILIAALGLLGMMMFTLELRTKEIGIRKVIGASVPGILILISKDYAKLLFVSIVLSIPVSFWLITKWLENFYYRIEPGPEAFIIATLSILFVSFLVTGYHSVKAALTNPVDALKDE